MHVEADVVGWGAGRGDGLDGVSLRNQSRDVQFGVDREAGDENVAGEEHVVLRPLQAELGVGQGTDPLRIAYANILAVDREVGVEAVLVSQVTGHAQQAAAAHGGERFYLQPVLIEFQSSMQLAEAVGYVFER